MNQSELFKPTKPILKWVGGKTQILDKILGEFPREIDNYHELFLGGGSVLLALLTLINNNTIKLTSKIYVYDINEPLIYIFKNIQKSHNELYQELITIVTEYTSCEEADEKTQVNRKPITLEQAKLSKENYYYWIRQRYNKLSSNEKKIL